MKCLVCKTHDLSERPLAQGPASLACDQCGGHWIAAARYWEWLERHGPRLPEQAAELTPSGEPSVAKLCPDCGHLLLPYRVGHGTDFRIDHCATCNGVWLDGGEWEALKARNLHDDLPAIVTSVWQRQVEQARHAQVQEDLLCERFGPETLAELRRFKAWLDGQPKRAQMLAFLTYGT